MNNGKRTYYGYELAEKRANETRKEGEPTGTKEYQRLKMFCETV
jgi:hypothetical protein